MGIKFLSHRTTPGRSRDGRGDARAPEITLEGRDHQQALVLGALRRGAGAPVSYAELRAAGVEFPASVVSELELAGVAIERCLGEGRRAVSVRLDPANDPAERLAAPTPTSEAPFSAPPVRGNSRRRVLAVTTLLAGLAVAAVVVAISASRGDHGNRVPIAKQPHSRVVVAAAVARRAVVPRATHPPPAVPVSPALATELEAQGHSMLEAGQYGDAVPVLRRAVLATGESVGTCVEPDSTTCLTYAYALYDLGRAVRLSGQPQAAVPILERRLQIDNQRSTVGAELQLARQGIG